jgi:hypothetical protein
VVESGTAVPPLSARAGAAISALVARPPQARSATFVRMGHSFNSSLLREPAGLAVGLALKECAPTSVG